MTSNIFKLIFLGIISSLIAYVFYAQAAKLESKDKNTEDIIKRLQLKSDSLKDRIIKNRLDSFRIALSYKDSMLLDKDKIVGRLKTGIFQPSGKTPQTITANLSIDDKIKSDVRRFADSLKNGVFKIGNKLDSIGKSGAGPSFTSTTIDSNMISNLIKDYNNELNADLTSFCNYNLRVKEKTDSISLVINYAQVLVNEMSNDESQLQIFNGRLKNQKSTILISKNEKIFGILSILSKQIPRNKKIVIELLNELCNKGAEFNNFFKLIN